MRPACLIKFWGIPVALFTVDCGSTVIRHKDAGYAAKELIHVDMGCDPSLCLFINKSFYIRILAVSQNTDKDPCISNLASVRIDDMSGITCRFEVVSIVPLGYNRVSSTLSV